VLEVGVVRMVIGNQFQIGDVDVISQREEAKLILKASYIPRWYTCPQKVTHPRTNRSGTGQLCWPHTTRYHYATPPTYYY